MDSLIGVVIPHEHCNKYQDYSKVTGFKCVPVKNGINKAERNYGRMKLIEWNDKFTLYECVSCGTTRRYKK